MPVALTMDERRTQLEQLWLDNRYEFLTEYSRVVGQPVNDPTMSLRAIIDRILDCEATTGCFGR